MFTFLYSPGLEATNNVSERAIRALIGAQELGRQGQKPFDALAELLCSSDQHKILDVVPATRETPQDSSPAPPRRFVPDGFHAPRADLTASA